MPYRSRETLSCPLCVVPTPTLDKFQRIFLDIIIGENEPTDQLRGGFGRVRLKLDQSRESMITFCTSSALQGNEPARAVLKHVCMRVCVKYFLIRGNYIVVPHIGRLPLMPGTIIEPDSINLVARRGFGCARLMAASMSRTDNSHRRCTSSNVVLWYARDGIVRLHTYGTNIYNMRTLDDHALYARVIRVYGVNMSARAGAESVCIREGCAFPPADVGET